MVSAVGRWLQNSGEDPRDVFLWMCFFCNNQYRIQDEPGQHSFSPFSFFFFLVWVVVDPPYTGSGSAFSIPYVPYEAAAQASQTGSDDLREIFESHLVEAGRMLVLLDTIVPGAYLMTHSGSAVTSICSVSLSLPK